jgi:hypothetical protein
MRFAVTADHRDFFSKKNYIEFENLLSAAQAADLKNHAEQTLANRLRLPLHKLADRPSTELFKAGYDLWRDSDPIKKATHKHGLASLASELFQIVPIRLGFDQYLLSSPGSPSPLSQASTLQELSCLSPLSGALILVLEDLVVPVKNFPLPLNAGNGLFISPSLPIPWPELFGTVGLHLFMMGFAMDKTFFRADTKDPHAVNLKKLGYVFNDLLKDNLHPILVRRR